MQVAPEVRDLGCHRWHVNPATRRATS